MCTAAATFLSKCAHLHLVPRETITRTLKYGKIFAVSGVFIRESVHKYSLKKKPNYNNNKNKESVNLGKKHPGQNRK